MSKTQTFTVTLTFSEKVTSDEDVAIITHNIALGLQDVADHQGLSPDDAEYYTTKIEVTPQFLPELKFEILTP